MKNEILKKIESLPPLPQSVIDLEKFRQQTNKEYTDLNNIIQKDPLVITSLLRVANSSMFSFRDKVDTTKRAIGLLGINFTISIALGSIIEDLIDANLDVYGASTENFMTTSNLATMLVTEWASTISVELAEELLLPAFLQETGKFIISDIVNDLNKKDDFKNDLRINSIADTEEKFTGYSCAKITGNIFKHWNLNHDLIFSIVFVGDLENAPEEYREKVKILEIIKILCKLTDPLSDEAIEDGLDKAREYGFDTDDIISAINRIKFKIIE